MEKVVMLGGIGLAMFGMVAGLLLGPQYLWLTAIVLALGGFGMMFAVGEE